VRLGNVRISGGKVVLRCARIRYVRMLPTRYVVVLEREDDGVQ